MNSEVAAQHLNFRHFETLGILGTYDVIILC